MNSVNTFPVVAAGRRPRSIVKVSGTAVPGWIDCAVTNNAYAEADTFRVTFGISMLPASNNVAWFSQQTEIFVEILTGFPSNPNAPNAAELTSLIYGRVDDIELDPVQRALTLTGRDLTAVFIDTRLTTQYQNKTASQIVQAIAQKHGLAASVQTTHAIVGSPALAPVGTYYLRDNVRLQTSNSEWDLITWLARESGLVTFVQAQTLYFVADPRTSATPYLIQWQPPNSAGGSPQSNVQELSLSRSLTVAKGISVTVQCANFLGPTIVRSYPRAPRGIKAGGSSPFGPTQNYYFNLPPGKTAAQVEAYAEAKFNEISSHAMKLKATLPADGLISVSVPVKVQGTGTAFDQTYFPRAIVRRMDMGGGYNMDIDAQNTTPELDASATQL